MRRSLLVILCLAFLTTSGWVQTDDLKQYLHDHYANRTFIIRDFLSGHHLSYDSLGSPTGPTSLGDWTDAAFVTIGDDPLIENNHLVLNAQRMAVIFTDKRFQLSAMQPPKANKKHKHGPGFVEFEIELSGTPSPESVNAVLSKVFLNSRDSFVDLVPGYWQPCVSSGLAGDASCAFAPELLTMLRSKTEVPQPKEIPVVPSQPKETSVSASQQTETSIGVSQPNETSIGTYSSRVGGGGIGGGRLLHPADGPISPPRAVYAPEPEYNDVARALKLNGTVMFGLVVNKDGRASDIRILRPIGAGLDAKFVQAVQKWRFEPAKRKRSGEPVAVQIVVETNFHLY